jgi:hypothetical protein
MASLYLHDSSGYSDSFVANIFFQNGIAVQNNFQYSSEAISEFDSLPENMLSNMSMTLSNNVLTEVWKDEKDEEWAAYLNIE